MIIKITYCGYNNEFMCQKLWIHPLIIYSIVIFNCYIYKYAYTEPKLNIIETAYIFQCFLSFLEFLFLLID